MLDNWNRWVCKRWNGMRSKTQALEILKGWNSGGWNGIGRNVLISSKINDRCQNIHRNLPWTEKRQRRSNNWVYTGYLKIILALLDEIAFYFKISGTVRQNCYTSQSFRQSKIVIATLIFKFLVLWKTVNFKMVSFWAWVFWTLGVLALGVSDFGWFGLGYFGTLGLLGFVFLGFWLSWARVFWVWVFGGGA